MKRVHGNRTGRGRLVLKRREEDETNVKLTLDRNELENLLHNTPEGTNPNIGFSFRTYNILIDENGVGNVNIAFNDPDRYFQFDRPERVVRQNRNLKVKEVQS